jgi:D-lactate dehydrogenase
MRTITVNIFSSFFAELFLSSNGILTTARMKRSFGMKIAFFDTKPYDYIWFEPLSKEYGYQIRYCDYRLNADTAVLAEGYDVACVFVNDKVCAKTIDILKKCGVKMLALRCAGYNNVDISAAAKAQLPVVRVPSYSPAAVAEHTAALLLSVNRKTHRAYYRIRDNNFSINGLMGFDLNGKTAGIIGVGQIGSLFATIAFGFGMRVLAYDPFPKEDALEYVTLDQLIAASDIISLHCPLTPDTYHIINKRRVKEMKKGVIIINTSRGALIDTEALLEGLIDGKIGGAGLDVYEEESDYFFEDKSGEIIRDEELSRLLTLPNVLVTSHQAFFTREAMQAIAMVTLENICALEQGRPLENLVLPR